MPILKRANDDGTNKPILGEKETTKLLQESVKYAEDILSPFGIDVPDAFLTAVANRDLDTASAEMEKICETVWELSAKEQLKNVEEIMSSFGVEVPKELLDAINKHDREKANEIVDILLSSAYSIQEDMAAGKLPDSEIAGRLMTSVDSIESSESISSADSPEDCLLEIDNMDGHAFESWCAQFLEKIGFVDVNVTPGSGDQGGDITAVKDSVQYIVQCKRHSNPVGNKAVQEVISAKILYNCHVAVVLTNNYFTKSAKELAAKANILLWDRNWLTEMILNLLNTHRNVSTL